MADTTGIRANQIKSTDRHGNSTQVQMSDGSGTSGHLASFDANANVTDLAISALTISESQVTGLITDLAGKVPTSRQIIAGAGLTGGGDLTADRTLAADTNVLAGVAGITIDGGGSVPATGSKGFVQVPYAGTITGWTLIADQSGSAQITVKKSTYSGFPSTSSIVASAPPNLSTAQKSTSTTLTGWTTAITSGDVLEFNLDSVTTCTRITLELQITKA